MMNCYYKCVFEKGRENNEIFYDNQQVTYWFLFSSLLLTKLISLEIDFY